MVDPALGAPDRKRLRCVDVEEVQLRVVTFVAELCTGEPVLGELVSAVGHVFAAEHAQLEHLLRGELGGEFRVEVFSHGLGEDIGVVLLHEVVYGYGAVLHNPALPGPMEDSAAPGPDAPPVPPFFQQ